MKKFISCVPVIILMLLFPSCGNVFSPEVPATTPTPTPEQKVMDGVFRYANWGDSMEKIEKLEDAEYVEKAGDASKSCLVYAAKLAACDANALYFFENNQFVNGLYIITDVHTNDTLHIDDFNSINDALIEKYGEPVVNNEKWMGDLFKDNPGMALYYGDVKYMAIWESENFVISHSLSSDNFEINHGILYSNPNAENKPDTSGL